MTRFWVPGPLPGLNEIIEAAKGAGGRGYGYSKLKKQWTQDIAWHAKAARIPKFTTIRLDLTWVEPIYPNKAQRDRDNIEAGGIKFLLDGLKLAGIIPDDKPANYLGSAHHHEKGLKPGVWVTIVDASEQHRSLTPVLVVPEQPPSHRGTYKGQTKPGG